MKYFLSMLVCLQIAIAGEDSGGGYDVLEISALESSTPNLTGLSGVEIISKTEIDDGIIIIVVRVIATDEILTYVYYPEE